MYQLPSQQLRGVKMNIPRNASVLSRAASLIALIDLFLSIIGLIAFSAQLAHQHHFVNALSNWKLSSKNSQNFQSYPSDLFATYRTIVVVILVIYTIPLLFSVILLFGIRKEKPAFVYAWYVPNGILIAIIAVCLVLVAFTRFGLVAVAGGGCIIFRTFETWIIKEYHMELESHLASSKRYDP